MFRGRLTAGRLYAGRLFHRDALALPEPKPAGGWGRIYPQRVNRRRNQSEEEALFVLLL